MELNFYQLDEEFGQRMDQISDERYFKFRRRRLFLNNWLGRLYICYLGQFCQIDLYGGRQIGSNNPKWPHKQPFNPRYSTNKNRWWPPLALVLFSYSCARLVVNMYFQYIYDYHLLRYERYKTKESRSVLPTARNSFGFQSSSSNDSNQQLLSSNLNYQLIAQTIGQNLTKSNDDYEQMLIRNVQSARATLRLIGAPYMDLNFVIEIIYYILVTASLTVLYLMKLYYALNVFDYGLIRSILDLKTERYVCNQLIREEVNKFIYSSRNFTEACIEQSKQFAKEHLFYRHKFEQIYARAELQRFLLDHRLTIKQLEQMALNGILLPCNRTPEWIGSLTHWTCFWNLIILGYAFLGVVFFAFIVFYLIGIEIQFSLCDIMTIVEAGILVAIILFAGVFYMSLSIISAIDQLYLVGDICKKIRKCIQENRRMFDDSVQLMANHHHHHHFIYNDQQQDKTNEEISSQLVNQFKRRLSIHSLFASSVKQIEREKVNKVQPRETNQSQGEAELADNNRKTKRLLQIESSYTQMNANLLEVLILYKIFVAQVRPISRTIGAFGFALLVLMFTVPINTRLHTPYFEENLKLYAMLFGVLMATVVDICLIPICYMYSECVNIYRCLSSLMAHLVEITNHPMAGRVYDMHTIWLLRKELSHPERLTSQFTIHTLGINFTFANLLRVHFWVGLISLSIIIDTKSSELEFFGSIFNDPLGMFD